MDALSSYEELRPLLETVWVTEGHFGQGSTTAGVMDNILRGGRPEEMCRCSITNNHDVLKSDIGYLHNPLDVTMAFSEVNMPESSSTFPVLDVGFEHGARTFSLSPDHTSHRVLEQTTVSVIYRLDM